MAYVPGKGQLPFGDPRNRPRGVRGREILTMALAFLALVLMGALLAPIIFQGEEEETSEVTAPAPEPMAYPLLDQAPELPSREEIDERSSQLEFFEENPQALALTELDSLTMAWIERKLAEDAEAPPIPRRFTPDDPRRPRIRAGTPVLVVGRLLERESAPVEGGETWQRMLIQIGDSEFVQAIAPPDAPRLPVGERIHVVGRYAGLAHLPAEGGGEERLPVIAVRSGSKAAKEGERITGSLELPDKEEFRDFNHDPSIFDDLDDVEPVLEYRAYYYLLGQTLRDISSPGAYEDVKSANELAPKLHLQPSEYRGEMMRVEGRVYNAWKDPAVTADQPYGVENVYRIWIGRREKSDRHLHAYEVAAIVPPDKEVPKKGDYIAATGRFLKTRGYKIDKNPIRDRALGVHRKSDRVFFKMIVAHDFEYLERADPGFPLWESALFTGVALSLLLWMTVLILRERRFEDRVRDPVRKLREGRREMRRRLREKDRKKEAPGGGDDAEGTDSDDSSGDPEGGNDEGAGGKSGEVPSIGDGGTT